MLTYLEAKPVLEYLLQHHNVEDLLMALCVLHKEERIVVKYKYYEEKSLAVDQGEYEAVKMALFHINPSPKWKPD